MAWTHHLWRGIAVVVLATVGGVVIPPGAALAGQIATRPGAAVAGLSPPAALTAAVQPTLRLGSRGASVTYLQRRLAALHYDIGTVDGVFGSNTYHAVVAFQKVNGLSRDGVVGPTTWA